jgi:hypothetical protein
MTRTADTEFRGSFREPPYFEDLSERSAVKLTSMLRLTGRPHYTLWAQEIGGAHFKERTGQFFPIYYLDVEVTDTPIETREPVEVGVRIRLGKHLDADGRVERLISEAHTEAWCTGTDGRRLRIGGTHKQAVFTSPHAPPGERRVRILHPSLGLGDLPERNIRPMTMEDLLALPADAGTGEPCADAEAHVWSYQQTDPNGHVHAMDYVRVLEVFGADQLARRGRAPRDYFFARAQVLFRRPCFTGEWYRRSALRYRTTDGEDVLVGRIDPVATPDARAPSGPPATVVRLRTKKSLLSSRESDKGR